MTTITIDRAVVEQALKALEKADKISGYANNKKVITALRAALAQQAEAGGAVLVNRESREGVMFYSVDMIPDPATLKDRFELVKVYTAPPKRVPLSEEEAAALIELDPRMLKEFGTAPSGAAMELIRRTERAHGIGGQDER